MTLKMFLEGEIEEGIESRKGEAKRLFGTHLILSHITLKKTED